MRNERTSFTHEPSSHPHRSPAAKKSVWKKTGPRMWERGEDTITLLPTGKRGILGKGYQTLHGWCIDFMPVNGNNQRIVFKTKKEALAEIRRFIKKKGGKKK